jgi:hypothetical protein
MARLRVTLLSWLVLSLTAWNAAGLFTAVAWVGVLSEFGTWTGTLYIAAARGLWTCTGCFLLWGLRRRKSWTRKALLLAAALYPTWAWVDRLFIRNGVAPNWPFNLSVTLVLLGFTTWVVLDPKNITFFRREAYERQPED